MPRFKLTPILLLLPLSVGAAGLRMEVAVPQAWAGTDTVVVVPAVALRAEALRPTDRPQVVDQATGLLLPAQAWDADGDGVAEAVVVVTDAPAGMVDWRYLGSQGGWSGPPRVQAELSHRTGGRWDNGVYKDGTGWQRVADLTVPGDFRDHAYYLRYEGPGWESEKVGYRLYLDGRFATDIFGKTQPGLVLHGVGVDGYDSYHQRADWGMDILKVGPALGIGSFGVFHEGKVHGVRTVAGRRARVTADGPLMASHRLETQGWQVAGVSLDVTADLAIAAGSRVTRVNLQVDGPAPNLATGLVKHPGTTVRSGRRGTRWDFVSTWGEQSLGGGQLGMAVFYPRADLIEVTEDSHNHVVVLRPEAGLVEYAFLAVWSEEGPDAPKDHASFMQLLETERQRLESPVSVRVRTPEERAAMDFTLTADNVLAVVTSVAEAEMARRGRSLAHGEFDPEANRRARWTYTTGLLLLPYEELAARLGEPRLLAYSYDIMSSYIQPDGSIVGYRKDEYNIDHLNPGKNLMRLHAVTGEERFKLAADLLRAQMVTHPRTTEGGFWHKQRYPNQMWLDGLYMGAAFLAEYASRYAEPALFDDIVNQFVLMEKVALDPQDGLLRHAWEETRTQVWADAGTGRSPHVWGRAVGWYVAALADTWGWLPADHPGRPVLAGILDRTVRALAPYQHSSGLWYQVVELPGRAGNYLETSATAMVAYAIFKGVRDGHLARELLPIGERAFTGLVLERVIPDSDGRPALSGICQVAGLGFGRDGSFEYYMSEKIVDNDPKGMGPFLLAGLQLEALLRGR